MQESRTHQENLIAQLKRVGATRMPVDTLLSNWAYMVMAALAWTLKAWFALRLPETGRWAAGYTAEKRAVLRRPAIARGWNGRAGTRYGRPWRPIASG